MRPVLSHRWDLSEQEAAALQSNLSTLVVSEDRLPQNIRKIAGVDVAYDNTGPQAYAAISVMDAGSGEVEDVITVTAESPFPYLPGLFSFREIPALVAAFEKLDVRPDLVICDGQGIAHPRGFGLASHLGVLYDFPTIGCAKTRLVGESSEPGPLRGDWAPLVWDGRLCGAVLRTQDRVKPVYVSPGHRISVLMACEWVLRLCPRYRIPEPLRFADQAVNRMKRQAA
jgi:deoxyribonuclease V